MLGIRRREFITMLGGAAAWPIAARGQQTERMQRIGLLMNLAHAAALGRSGYSLFQGLRLGGGKVVGYG